MVERRGGREGRKEGGMGEVWAIMSLFSIFEGGSGLW